MWVVPLACPLEMDGKAIEHPTNATEQWLVETVRQQAKAAGIGMPEVAVYESPDVNAFATGTRRNNALIAVSTSVGKIFQ